MSEMSKRIAEKAAFQEPHGPTGGYGTREISSSSKEKEEASSMEKQAAEKCSDEKCSSHEETSSFEKHGDKWKTKPRGWTQKSLEKYQKSMTGSDVTAGDVTKCIEKIKGHVDDPGAFCSSLEDATKGPEWRHHKKKKHGADTLLGLAQRLVEQPESVTSTQRIANILTVVADQLVEQ